MKICLRCDGYRWVCEEHPDRPLEGPRACGCGAAGEPCPVCNPADADTMPALPPDFEVDEARDLETDPIILDNNEREEIEAALAELAHRARKTN